jgi:hypothetical protein
MTRLFLPIAFIFSVTLSYGQKAKAKDFYNFLQTQIRKATAKQDTIIIVEESKACFGSTWKAVLKPQNNYTTITFYVDKSIGDITDTSTSLLKTIVDTSFSVQTQTLLENLEGEIKYLKNHLVVSYTTQEYFVEQGDVKRKFKLKKGQGVYYWLRFNKSWTQYLADR